MSQLRNETVATLEEHDSLASKHFHERNGKSNVGRTRGDNTDPNRGFFARLIHRRWCGHVRPGIHIYHGSAPTLHVYVVYMSDTRAFGSARIRIRVQPPRLVSRFRDIGPRQESVCARGRKPRHEFEVNRGPCKNRFDRLEPIDPWIEGEDPWIDYYAREYIFSPSVINF